MNLTEPQAGSDLNAVRTRAERAEDGSYRLFGQKIFITYGEHDMAENIVHLVLARLPGAPAGTRGLSLFLAPKFLVNADGSLGARNDLRCASIEHKLGIHGSPTCVMVYGDNDGAKAWLIGEENRGLAAMFVMMNAARLAVGTQGVAIGDRAYQQALAYARERRQGRGAERRRRHGPDHRAPRRAAHADDDEGQRPRRARDLPPDRRLARPRQTTPDTEAERTAAANRAALLTPIAKAFSTDIGDEATSIGVQVHGGMGFIEETGAAQHMRDSRIAAIYEGANGIHAIDLVQRKLPLGRRRNRAQRDRRHPPGGERRRGQRRRRLRRDGGAARRGCGRARRIRRGSRSTGSRPTRIRRSPARRNICACSGSRSAARVWPKPGLPRRRWPRKGDDESELGRVGLARFFAEKLATAAPGLARAIASGAMPLEPYEAILAESA